MCAYSVYLNTIIQSVENSGGKSGNKHISYVITRAIKEAYFGLINCLYGCISVIFVAKYFLNTIS